MTIMLITIGSFLITFPFILWMEKNAIRNEELQGIKDWHNFRTTLDKGNKK
jgi:hypothetical protein